ncbi:asparagine synthase (glutamine-hydrolyzing) [Legionella sp. W05-934-2]|uniref:asparagine synthase (glutamine-hydrolyzing) n=1 Tax=Legionella sp. W05-934-2 TaxID=1198649 RepID=UPI0034623E08
MCGIAGIYNLSGSPFSGLNNTRMMAKKMTHRGPNGSGYFIGYKQQKKGQYLSDSDTKFDDSPADLFLAHTRLSIIDLSNAASQPMSCDNQRYWITYNGELFNYREIAAELNQLGVHFSSDSDTEVLLKAYCHWGPKALDKFNGMFAFAIWDEKEKTLFCARDRVGIKPFYYTIQNQKFIFASDIKTIIASNEYHPEINIEGLYHALSYGVAPRPMTCFQGIQALPQGHWMLIKPNGSMQLQRYWQVPVGTQDHSMTEQHAAELLEDVLKKSVNRMLVSDVPLGTFMSGGVDSTLISAMAAELHPGIKAFTLGYEDYANDYDEIPQARATAALHPLEHIVETIKMDSILENIDDNIRNYEEPFYSLSPNYLISKIVAKNNLTVVLNGLGGDELFAGYRHFRWANRAPIFKLAAPFAKPLKGKKEFFARISEFSQASSPDKYHSLLFTIMSENMKQQMFNSPIVKEYNTFDTLHKLYVGDGIRFEDSIEAMSYMDLVHYIGNHHVYRVDQFTMLFSLEGRFPFLDHEVIEAAFRIPSKFKIKQGQQKYILREVAKKYIAPECLSMKKKGFSLPMSFWLKNELANYSQSQLKKLAHHPLFSSQAVNTIWPRFMAGELDSRHVWQFVSVQAWLDMFFN